MVASVVNLLKPLLDNSAVAITVVDLEGHLTLFNKAAELLTGYSREEVLGRPVSIFYESPAEVELTARAVMEKGKVEDYETTLVGKDGRRTPVSILLTMLADPSGEVVGSLGITVDISAKKKLEEELSRERQRVLFYNDLICHDIRNFTQTALGLFDLLLSGDDLGAERRRLLQLCQRQSRRTRDLINRVRTLARLESDGAEVSSPQPLAPALAEAIRGVQESFPDRRIEISSPEASELLVTASPLLPELLHNLVANGVAHNPSDHPSLWVKVDRTSRDGRRFVEVAVEDDGPGIPDELKRVIFERYDRMSASGSGIGLSLVKALAHRFGGEIWAEDRVAGSPSEGARLVVSLPEVEP
ncbi:MAG: PAS domain-containing sensor histidine kinase [Polyangia bacterium]|jgi:PAS domain S-box-containing protein|nr:PAS domain-containing sensor histidine kinase [Polyangia bacterium]